AAMLSRRAYAAGPVDPNRFFLLSDTHIAEDPKTMKGPVNMYDNLKKTCVEVLGMDGLAASVIVNGDCAYSTGEVADYTTFTELIKPFREAGMPVHLTLGNHDRRDLFWDAIKDAKDAGQKPGDPIEDRYVTVIESPNANWF